MKAIVCRAFGAPSDLKVEDVPSPRQTPGGVAIEIHRAGLNFPDVLIVQGKYQLKPPFPFSPGAEVAGVVTAVGEKVTAFAVGERVMALCSTGGFAQEVVAEQAAVFKIPDTMSFDDAAGFAMTYGTTYHALVDRAKLRDGETLLVTGAGGGVGIAAVQIGAALGAKVIAAAGSKEKRAAAAAAGAHETIDYTTENLAERVKALTGDRGADVIYDPVGGDVFDAALRCIAWQGRLLIIGFASGRIPDIPANRLLLKGCSAVGVFWGAFAGRDPRANRLNFERLFELYAGGKLPPTIGATYALEDAAQAIVDLEDRKITGKALIRVR
ncbi:MAG: NADPH:quinone oxidoreductase family protein [Candidatus Eremiobacteraeota bacterium]|nr:NADPH:quinone oxidoreductase family protein [Candidatus Eremiobacteraeota bacterium]